MKEAHDIQEAIRILAGTDDLIKYESIICKVLSVDLNANTCDCRPLNGDGTYVGMYLSANKAKGFLLIPKVDSFVTITLLNETDGFISMVSDVEQIYLAGDENGGLIKIGQLISQLNNLESVVKDLIIKYNSHVHATTCPAGTGAAGATTSIETGTITVTDRADIENTIIKHGNG